MSHVVSLLYLFAAVLCASPESLKDDLSVVLGLDLGSAINEMPRGEEISSNLETVT